MLPVAPSWLSGYARVILLMTVLLNLSLILPRYAYGLTLPFMEDSLSLSSFQQGSFFAAMSVAGMAGALAFGMLAPRFGSRFIIGFSSIVGGIAVGLLGASPNYSFALAMSAILGFTTMGSITPVMGLLSVWFGSRNRGTAAGLAAAGGGVSFIVVGALVPWLTGRDPDDGWRHTWYVLGGIVIATGILSLIFLRDRPREAAGTLKRMGAWPVEAYRNPLVWLVALLAFCSGWSEGLFATFFGGYLEDEGISVAVNGRLWMIVGVLGIVGGIFWGNISDRLGRGAGFQLSFIIVGVGLLMFWGAPDLGGFPVLGGFIVATVLFGVSFRAAYIICAAAAGDYVAPHLAAAVFGLMGIGAGLGGATGAPLGGYIKDLTGTLDWAFVLAAGGAAVAVVSSTFLSRPRAAQILTDRQANE